jgi:hypothetical protein
MLTKITRFILAKLQFDYFSRQRSVGRNRKALKTLPPDLHHANAVSRIRSRDKESMEDLGLLTLLWISTAIRPLSVAELLEALAIEPLARDLDGEDRSTIKTVLECCVGLVIVESTTNTVHFAH